MNIVTHNFEVPQACERQLTIKNVIIFKQAIRKDKECQQTSKDRVFTIPKEILDEFIFKKIKFC